MVFFPRWILFALTHPNFEASKMLQFITRNKLTSEELAAYDAPFPSHIYKAGPRTLPSMMAAIEENDVEAWKNLSKFDKPFLYLGGKGDQEFGSLEVQKDFTDHIPGTKGQAHQRYAKANHFIQDDIGVELANKVISFMKSNPM